MLFLDVMKSLWTLYPNYQLQPFLTPLSVAEAAVVPKTFFGIFIYWGTPVKQLLMMPLTELYWETFQESLSRAAKKKKGGGKYPFYILILT